MAFADDSNFYLNQAKKYCENIHSTVVEVESGSQLIFIPKTKEKFSFSTTGLLWKTLFFNRITKPELIDVTNLQEEMIRVYHKSKKH